MKVWDKREFKDLDGNVELGIRNIKVALRRLRKFARTGSADELDPAWLLGKRRIGITAGASAPEVLVQALVERLRLLGVARVQTLDGIKEEVQFPLPKGLSGLSVPGQSEA